MSTDMTQFYQVFFDEAQDNLASMESLLLALDPDAPSLEDLNAIFRAAHSIKGGAGTFGFADVAEVTHVAETLLDRLRKAELSPTSAMIDALLQAGDVIKSQLAAHKAGGQADAEPAQETCARLQRLAAGASEDPRPPVEADARGARFRVRFVSADPVESVKGQVADVAGLGEVSGFKVTPAEAAGEHRVRYEFELTTAACDSEINDFVSFVLQPEQLSIDRIITHAAGSTARSAASDALEDATGARPSPRPVQPGSALPRPQAGGSREDMASARGMPLEPAQPPEVAVHREVDSEKASLARQGESSSIRVSVEKVDQLINLVGELVITQAMLAQTASNLDQVTHEALFKGMGLLERNTRDLQEAVMSIRMMPISFVFSRFPRVVRELAAKLGKQVDLKTVGEGTELDKGLIEKIADPLTHLVRNAIDHGVELPDVRRAAGKPARGTISLRAFHQGGNIVIEVSDDGAGLNRDKLLAKARSRGMPVSDAMSDQEVWQLIFEAGFSTAEVVTDVSGRGVGMDVVRRNIQAMGGSVEIDSALGMGTRISIRLPLTLAILDGLSVAVEDQIYIIPLTYIVESLQPRLEDIKTVRNEGSVIHVRGEYLPIVSAHEVFNASARHADMSAGIIVIVESDGIKKALYVDELLGQHQVVIKSLETNYRKVHGISGATIMGDGRVALILDVGSLIRGKRPELRMAA